MYRTVRIKVLRREVFEDLIDEHVPADRERPPRCPVFADGQEFLVEGWPNRPDGFCEWAWDDIRKSVLIASFGGRKEGISTKDGWIACCTDGLRPVVFLIAPVEAPKPGREKEDA
jgi:uncharacterized repeat protein (TIGR04076 family)